MMGSPYSAPIAIPIVPRHPPPLSLSQFFLVVCTGTEASAPLPSTTMWMLAADDSVEGVLTALVVLVLVWFE